MSFRTPDTDNIADKLDYVGVEVPHGWGNVLAGYTGAATLTNDTGTVVCERDTKAESGRSLKLVLVDTAVTGGTAIANHLVKNTNYTLVLANVPTPATAKG